MSLLKKIDVEKSDEMIVNILTKINSAATGCYQSLDLASIFRIIHQHFKNLAPTTASTIFCRKVDKMFEFFNQSGSLTLIKSHNTMQNIIDATRYYIVSYFLDSYHRS